MNVVDSRHWNRGMRRDVLYRLNLWRVAWSFDDTMPANSECCRPKWTVYFLPNPQAKA